MYLGIGDEGSVQYHAAIHQGAIEHCRSEAYETPFPYYAWSMDDMAMRESASDIDMDG